MSKYKGYIITIVIVAVTVAVIVRIAPLRKVILAS